MGSEIQYGFSKGDAGMRVNTEIIGRIRSAAIYGFVALGAIVLADIAVAQQSGGPGSLSPEKRQQFFQSLTDDERSRFFTMSPEDKQKFVQSKLGGKSAGPARRGAPGGATGGRPGSAKGGPPGGGRPGGSRRPPTLVELGEVTSEPMIKIYPITGRMVASQRGEIAARIKGNIISVRVKIGDRVEKGQVIADMDVSRLKLEAELKAADVLQARAKWKSAQAQVDLLNQELKRLERLRRSVAFSQARFEDKRQEVVKARSTVDETAAALKRAQASRGLARIDLKDAAIRAPYAGVVLNRHVSPGAYVNAGSRIISMLDDENLEIEADVPSDRLTALKPGSKVVLRIDAKTKREATVRAIIPDENPLARTRAVRLIPNFNGQTVPMVPNQSVVIDVPSSASGRRVVAVVKDAIVNQQSGNIVFVFQNGRVRPARVEIGEAFANKFEILSGLRPGMKIVIRGNELLRPGQPVRVAGASRRPGGKPSGRPSGRPGGRPSSGPEGARGPGGPGGGAIAAIPPEKRRAFFQSLSPDDRQKFFAMDAEAKKKFIASRLGAGGQR
jgi:RND family efflux transporter MFP subunit